MIRWPELAAALGVAPGELVSIVGGGGKTTAAFALAESMPGRAIITTTTKMGSSRTGGLVTLVDPTDEELAVALDANGAAMVWGAVDGPKALGVDPSRCGLWRAMADVVIVEADGSRRLPFKAPAAHEPVVPDVTTTLLACVGRGAIGQPINRACHRPELVAALAGVPVDATLTVEMVATVVTSGDGSRKACPPDATFAVLLNQVTEADAGIVTELGQRLHEIDPSVVFVTVAAVPASDVPGGAQH